ncbi:MAG TPA: PEGA domain-containing protein [Polyangiaceae bacterium]
MKARDVLFCCFAAAAQFAYAAPLHAADPEVEARERFDRAVKMYDEGNYDAALVEFQRAAALRPSFKLFYNMGQVRVALNDPAAALEAYRQYLAQGSDKVPAARRAQVQEEMKRLEQRVARLSVETDVPGAEVAIDDVSIGKTPLPAPVLVNSGSRRVQVRHPNYLPQSRVLSLAGGVQERATFRLAEAAPSAAPVPAASPASRSDGTPATPPVTLENRGSSAVWIGWVVSGALAAGAAVTGVMALSENSDLEKRRDQFVKSRDDFDSDAKRVRTLAIVSDGLGMAALAAGGVTLWLTLKSDRPEGRAATASTETSARRRLRVGVGPTGAVLRGSF